MPQQRIRTGSVERIGALLARIASGRACGHEADRCRPQQQAEQRDQQAHIGQMIDGRIVTAGNRQARPAQRSGDQRQGDHADCAAIGEEPLALAFQLPQKMHALGSV